MLNKFFTKIRSFSWEQWFLMIFGATFFIGIWHAFPMLDVIGDTSPFTGGVLRSIEAHSLLPGNWVAYGTLTFYLNYISQIFVLFFTFLYFHFDSQQLLEFLILNPQEAYWVARFMTALTGIGMLAVLYRFLKKEIPDAISRLTLLLLLFGNILTAAMLRTGKMWVLSVFLGTLSFTYLYKYLQIRLAGNDRDWKRVAFIAILFAFLAFANFPLAGYYLLALPIIFYFAPRTKQSYLKLAGYIFVAFILFLLIEALNYRNIMAQIGDIFINFHPLNKPLSSSLSFSSSIRLHLQQAIEVYPLMLVIIISLFTKVKNKPLAYLAAGYALGYFLLVSFLSNWYSDPGLYLRYLFPLGIFFFFLLTAVLPINHRISIPLLILTLLVYIRVLWLISMPTTYNQAYDYISREFGMKEILIINNIPQLNLPLNEASYRITKPVNCATKCSYILGHPDLINFKPIVVTKDNSIKVILNTITSSTKIIRIEEKQVLGCDRASIVKFGNNISDINFFDLEYNFGRWGWDFITLSNLGKNIYIYDAKQCLDLPENLNQ